MAILDDNGKIWVSGCNDCGQLGLGDEINRNVFTMINFDIDIIQICIEENLMVILDVNGQLWTCGYNRYGKLGLGDYIDRNVLTKINFDFEVIFL